MRNTNNKIRVSKVYKRFILSFLIVLLLPVSSFAFIFLQNYRELYREKVLKLARNSLEASIMELERTIEGLESFVAYNLMADDISEVVLLNDYSAEKVANIIGAEMIAQPILDGINYYNPLTPDTIYVVNGTYKLKYYYSNYMHMESEEHLLNELENSTNERWAVWEKRKSTKEGEEPVLVYIRRTWKDECWLFIISQDRLEKIINTENSVTVLQSNGGGQLYPFTQEEISDKLARIGGAEDCFTITVSSSDDSFTLTRYIHEEDLFAEVNLWQKSFFAVIIGILLIGGVLILVLTTFNEFPIRKLQREWRKKIPDIPENVVGLEALQFVMKTMEEQVLITESRHKKNQLLLQLIYGKDCETVAFRNQMREDGLFQQAEVYRVLIAVSEEQNEVSINKVGVYLEMFQTTGCELRALETSSGDASIIIAGMTREAERELKNKLLQIVEEIEKNVGEKMFFYVGGKSEELKNIHLSYAQALSCSQNKDSKAANRNAVKRVIYYRASSCKNSEKFRYPNEELNMLYSALVETDMDKASEVTEKLVKILKEQSDNRFISVSLYYDVLNIYYGAQAKLDFDIDSNNLEIDLLEMQNDLDEVKMILRIRDQFQNYIESYYKHSSDKEAQPQTLCYGQNEEGKSTARDDAKKGEEFIQKVLAFIDANCHSCDLSVSMVSDNFDISISNLSHRFKAQTGRTISDYVTEKKFGYAGELLRTTNYSVQKIASMTGYSQPASFIRKFKQFYSMTPVEYRNCNGNDRAEL